MSILLSPRSFPLPVGAVGLTSRRVVAVALISTQSVLRLPRWFASCIWAVALLFVGSAAASAPSAENIESSEAGLPLIQNFGPEQYGGEPQNWALAQDRQGVIYVGSTADGVLVFDGSVWSRVAVPNLSAVRALAADASGRIFVGAVGEFGYLKTDESGALQYESLLPLVPPNERTFADVWKVLPTRDGVYFASFTHIFRVRDSDVAIWKPRTAFHVAFVAGGTVFVREINRGLMKLTEDGPLMVPGGDRFATERIYALLPSSDPVDDAIPQLLIGTATQGWFIFDGASYEPWPTEVDEAVLRDKIYGAIRLENGRLAIATLQGGVYVITARGKLLARFTKASGLSGDGIYALLEDRQRGVWLAMETGIARIDLASPITHFADRAGLEGSVIAVQRHRGRLYVGSMRGVFRLEPSGQGTARFARLEQLPADQVWDFLPFDDALLVATRVGVFELRDDAVLPVGTSTQAASLMRSSVDPARVFVGTLGGIASVRRHETRWLDEKPIPVVAVYPRTIHEEPDGRLWLGDRNGGVMRVTFPEGWLEGNSPEATVLAERYGVSEGLPPGYQYGYRIGGAVGFAGRSGGAFRFDPASGRFRLDPAFSGLFTEGQRHILGLFEDTRGRVWMSTAVRSSGIKELGAALPSRGAAYRWATAPLHAISGRNIEPIFGDSDGVMWFGGAEGLSRYDPNAAVFKDPMYAAVVRKVTARDGHTVVRGSSVPAIAHADFAKGALRIEYAAPSYDAMAANRFQVLLEGLDSAWSDWSGQAYREYSSLPEGDYRFRVRARNAYGDIGAEAQLMFVVLPPWHRTWWARLGAAFLVVGTLWLLLWALFWTRFQIVKARADVLEERNRIAHEMHDSLGQGLAGIAMQLQAIRRARQIAPEMLDPMLERAGDQFTGVMDETRRAILALRPLVLERHGLVTALRELVVSYPHFSSAIQFELQGEPYPLPDSLELHVFRIAQEAITNAVRHAHATHICLRVVFGKKMLELVVTDNGKGIESGVPQTDRGLGLAGMRMRVDQLGGRIAMTSERDRGTSLTATVPLPSRLLRYLRMRAAGVSS